MFSLWGRTTPSCDTDKHVLDEQAKKALTTKQNSSKIYPALAVIHNQGLKDTTTSILSLPRSIQAAIYRHILIQDKEGFPVSAQHPDRCEEPALLTVSKDVRAIARPIFYREANLCSIEGFNIAALQSWIKKREQAMVPTVDIRKVAFFPLTAYWAKDIEWRMSKASRMAESLLDIANHRRPAPLPLPRPLSWIVDNEPNWTNLISWLKLFHQNKIEGYNQGQVERGIQRQLLQSVFGVVGALRGQKWELVLEVLMEMRWALVAVHAEWLVDYDSESEDGDKENGDGEDEDDT